VATLGVGGGCAATSKSTYLSRSFSLSHKHTMMATVSVLSIASLLMLFAVADARILGAYTDGQCESAHTAFYGSNDASGTMGILSIL
jgi:hypothetical protein